MQYCPIIAEVIDLQVRQKLGEQLILQVYDTDGKVVYERYLKYDLVSWNIFHSYFVFKLDQREGESHNIYIVHLDKQSAIIKIKDFAPNNTYKHLGINNSLLYYGSDNNIKIADIKLDLKDGQELEMEVAESHIINYDIPLPNRLHGFFENGFSKIDQYIMCIVETEDNQIDFARLYFWDRNLQNPVLEFYQYREVVPRELRNDPIKIFTQIIKANEFQFGIAVRKSGMADFYWNFSLTNSSTNQELFDDACSNFDFLYLKQTQSNQIYEIDLNNDIRVGLDVANNYLYTEAYWTARKYNLIKDHVKLFTSFTLSNTSFFVSYLNFVSIYDVISKTFIEHLMFESKCQKLFRTENNNQRSSLGEFIRGIVGVHLDTGDMVLIESEVDLNTCNDIWKRTDKTIQIVGKIESIVSDTRDFASHFFLTNLNGKKIFYGYKQDQIEDLKKFVKITDNDILVKFVSQNKEEDFALYNLSTYTLTTYINQNLGISFSVHQEQEYTIINGHTMKNNIHTAVKSFEGKHLFLFDSSNIYVLDIQSGLIIDTKLDQNIMSLQVIDDKYIYALMNKSVSLKRSAGFYFQNLSSLLNKEDDDQTFKMKRALVGKSNYLSYYRSDERLAYMTDYESVKIIPVLHRNTIALFGINKMTNYICFYKNGDRLIALDYNNVLTTYSLATGKVLKRHKLKTPVISSTQRIWSCDIGDEIYTKGYFYPKVLIYDTTPVDQSKEEFFGERLKCDLHNCTAYTGILESSFHNFTVLQIMNETEVKVHYSFIHVIISSEKYQRMYLSDDLDYMIERLQNQRVYFYRRLPSQDGVSKWVIIRRIKQFPKDIADFSHYFYLFSPNLQYYLDFDQNDGCFQIKKTVDQTVYRTIPKGLLNTANIDVLARKFMWIDNFKIRIVNMEGIEKVLDLHNNLEQISYGTVPMLTDNDYLNHENHENFNNVSKGHYFYDRSVSNISHIEKRLRAKFQDYFRAYFVDNNKQPEMMYNQLFTVDYTQEKPIADLSFSYFHWKLAEVISDPKRKIKIKKFNKDEIKLLLLNIFPQGNTILHLAVKNVGAIKKFYNIIREQNLSGEKFEIPFVNNFAGETPLHLCLKTKNYKSADLILQNLIDTPLDSHIRGILDILPQLIANDLPSLKNYLDGRFIQTLQIQAIRRGSIKYQDGNDEYAVDSCELWPDKLTVESKLFTKSKLDSEIKLEFLDIPSVHSYNGKIGQAFFKELADCTNMDIFACKSVHAIIDYKWPLVKEYTIKILFLPFIFYICLWIIYSNGFNGQLAEDTDDLIITDKVIIALLYAFSVYFLFNESRQIINQGYYYLLSIWNYTDLLPPVFIITVISLSLVEYQKSKKDETYDPNNFITTIHSVASLLMWAKLLYFLRIFYKTGYLIRMLTNVIWDMKVFLLILFLVYFGFGEAFLRLSESSDPEAAFIQNYAYSWVYAFRLSMGDTATDTFNDTIQPVTLWIMWCICLLLTNIVMLNMLIAIIGESFSTVNSMQKQASYQERARIISENTYLIPNYRKRDLNDEGSYIITAMEITEQEEVDATKIVHDQFANIEDSLTKMKTEIMDKHKSLEEKVDLLVIKYQK